MLQAIDESQSVVNGVVRLKFYKGNVTVVGRQSADTFLMRKLRPLKMMRVLIISRC